MVEDAPAKPDPKSAADAAPEAAPKTVTAAVTKLDSVKEIMAVLDSDKPKTKAPAKKPAPPRPASLLQLDVDLERAWTAALAAGAASSDIAKAFRKYAGSRLAAEK